jgi:hypothetical protein
MEARRLRGEPVLRQERAAIRASAEQQALQQPLPPSRSGVSSPGPSLRAELNQACRQGPDAPQENGSVARAFDRKGAVVNAPVCESPEDSVGRGLQRDSLHQGKQPQGFDDGRGPVLGGSRATIRAAADEHALRQSLPPNRFASCSPSSPARAEPSAGYTRKTDHRSQGVENLGEQVQMDSMHRGMSGERVAEGTPWCSRQSAGMGESGAKRRRSLACEATSITSRTGV